MHSAHERVQACSTELKSTSLLVVRIITIVAESNRSVGILIETYATWF
jgi:hypothetical protein